MARIVLIGAGSTSFAPSVIADLARCPELAGSTLALVDLDEDILQVMALLAARIVAASGADLKVVAATDRREVLAGADFVVTTFAVGGTAAWQVDVDVPASHGLSYPVGDTAGPGGISRALRHVPVLVAIARDMEELCPRARLFNYTNPMTALCRGARRETSIDVVGLCVGPELTRRFMADLLELPREGFSYHGGGINHLFWVLDARYRGRDVYPMARSLAAGDAPDAERDALVDAFPELREYRWQPTAGMEAYEPVLPPGQRAFVVELLDALGYYPGPGDRHVTEFFPELFPGGPLATERYGVLPLPVSSIVAKKDTLRRSLEEQARGAAPLDPRLVAGEVGHSEEVVPTMAAVSGDSGLRLYGNVPNRGLIANLPRDAIVEVPLLFGAHGWRALGVGDLPGSLLPTMTRRLACIELTVEAALSGDRRVARQALLADGAVTSVAHADALLADLLQAQSEYLPQFRDFTLAVPTA